jgi:hypothetical protein
LGALTIARKIHFVPSRLIPGISVGVPLFGMFSLPCRVERHGPRHDLSGGRSNLAMQVVDGPQEAPSDAATRHEVAARDGHAERADAEAKKPRCVDAGEVRLIQVGVGPVVGARASYLGRRFLRAQRWCAWSRTDHQRHACVLARQGSSLAGIIM